MKIGLKSNLPTFLFLVLIFAGIHSPVAALTTQDVDKYLWQKQVVKNIAPTANDLRQELAKEITKMIAAGHLAPYRMIATESETGNGNIYLWYHAGEPIYTLAEAYKYLPEGDSATKQSLLTYMRQELTNYSPVKATMVYDRAPWLPLDQGARREYYPLGSHIRLLYHQNNQWQPAVQTFYHLWNYVDATGDTAYVTANWNTIRSLFDKLKTRSTVDWMDKGGCVAKYGDVAGCVGMARLAQIAAQNGVRDDATSRAAEGFTAGQDFDLFIQNSNKENRYFDPIGGDDLDPTANVVNSYVYLNLFPETARFIRDYNFSKASSHIEKEVFNIPTWNLTYGPAFVGGETNYTTPITAHTIFQAHAMVLQEDAEFLRSKIDVPIAKVGDLYYLQSLISAIKAYGQTCWVDVRTGAETCEPPTGDTCPTDINLDKVTNQADYDILFSDFFATTPSNPRSDIDSNDLVDLVDFSLLAANFMKVCK